MLELPLEREGCFRAKILAPLQQNIKHNIPLKAEVSRRFDALSHLAL